LITAVHINKAKRRSTTMGKTTSKLDKRRSQSISWSYKFGTASRRKKHAALVITSLPHMELGEWLKRLDLAEYGDKFRSFNGVEELLFLSESDIKKLGIRNNAHRARIVSSLVALREKLVQESHVKSAQRNGADDQQKRAQLRHSVAVDGSRSAKTASTATEQDSM
uniref:SAM domain-containing protein n=1 Tax=Anopheles coluzzii TaxID=1518534 RepID=A0A8W7PJF2_ANOCL